MRLLVALLAALATTGAAASAAAALSPLHAQPDRAHGGRIVDSRDREVLLRGVNVNALAEYWQGGAFPTTFPLARADPRRLAAIGWDAVRLLISWSRVEPAPGAYDDAYLARVAAVVRRLARERIYTIVDMHQDAWGASLAARDGESCSPPQQPALGWDGAPAWATLDGGQPRCFLGAREANPAVLHAWQAFFENERGPGGAGIQDRFVAMWRHVARRFARATAVAGFDILNEPNALSDEQQRRLSALYARVLKAVRRGERDGRGRRHLVLFEPSVLWSATGHGGPPAFRHDRDVVYAPHIYTGGFDNGPITRAAFAVARREARGFDGAPVLAGEWGTDPARARPRGDGYFLAHQRLQDAFRFSATLWTWRESCGDPHKIADVRAGQTPVPWGEWEVDCATNTVRGQRAALVAELTRGYVRAAPGRLTATAWDPTQAVLRASGRVPHRAGRLVAFYPGVPRTRTVGLGHIGTRKLSGGGRLVTATARRGAWRLRIGRR